MQHIAIPKHYWTKVYPKNISYDAKLPDIRTERVYDENKNLQCVMTINNNNQRHSVDDKPAVILYRKDGSIKRETWYKNDYYHRSGGPAVIMYDENNTIIAQQYWIDGNRI